MKPNYAVQCERRICKLVGGRLTPGSGNKDLKGDVITKQGGVIEIKSTIYEEFSIEYEWLLKLERLGKQFDVCLVIVFGSGTGYVYYQHGRTGLFTEKWSTRLVGANNMPEIIRTNDWVWKLDDLVSLKEWLQ